jgi:hypothetical protein
VTRFLQRELGYYLGYAYLPEQVPVNGVVRIAVLEGRLDEVILLWPDKMPVERAVVEAYLARLVPARSCACANVERIVFLVNDLRGLNARFEVKAGRTPGTRPSSSPPSRRATEHPRRGRFLRLALLGRLASQRPGDAREPAGRGDGLVVNVLSSFTGGIQFVLGGYTLPVGSDGLKVGVSGSYVRYKLDEDLLDGVNLSGDATTVTAVRPLSDHPLAQPQPVRPGVRRPEALRRQAVRHDLQEEDDRLDAVRSRATRATTCSPAA